MKLKGGHRSHVSGSKRGARFAAKRIEAYDRQVQRLERELVGGQKRRRRGHEVLTTATTEKKAGTLEAARVAKLRHAHFLAKEIYKDAANGDPGGARALLPLPSFQRTVILREAKNIGFEAQSRSELSAVQLAGVCSSLQRFMREHDIPIPRAGRKAKGQSLGELVQIVLEKAAELGWDQATLDRFIERQTKRGRIETIGDALAVLGGLKGILRHRGTKTQR